MTPAHPILLVGSIPLDDSESVFRELASRLGSRANRYPDGETGARRHWVRWQRRIFENNSAFETFDPATNLHGINDAQDRRFYRLKPGVSSGAIDYPPLGFAEVAIESYGIFSRLKKDGVIPPGVRFQVSLPTALAIVSGFVIIEDRAAAEPPLERALARELRAIGDAIPHNELTIQWDVALEIVGYDGGYTHHFKDLLNGSIERLVRQIDMVPKDVELGIHFCYGDPGHKHIVEPPDAGTLTLFANELFKKSPRRIDYLHLPILRGWDADKYFAPLDKLKLPAGTELYLGLVHYTDGVAGTVGRMMVAQRHVKDFGIGTECGFGRRDPATVAKLLDMHRELASAP